VRAAVTTEGHGFDIVDVADPSPGPDELLIRVAACGVCGSDIKAQLYAPAGMIMGHELGGEIVGVDRAVGVADHPEEERVPQEFRGEVVEAIAIDDDVALGRLVDRRLRKDPALEVLDGRAVRQRQRERG